MKFLILMSTLTLSFTAAAANSPVVQQLQKIKPANNDCKEKGKKAETIVLPGGFGKAGLQTGKTNEALELIKSVKEVPAEDVKTIIAAIKEDAAIAMPHAHKLGLNDCAVVYSRLSSPLIYDIEKSKLDDNSKKNILLDVKSALVRRKYPTLLAAAIDAAIINEGLEKNVWSLKADDKKAFLETRAELKKFIPEINARMKNAGFDDLSEETLNDSEKLKKHPKFSEIKSIYLEEVEKSQIYSDKFAAYARSLEIVKK